MIWFILGLIAGIALGAATGKYLKLAYLVVTGKLKVGAKE